MLETRNPDWCLVVDKGHLSAGGHFYLSLGRKGTIVPITRDCMTVRIVRTPDERRFVGKDPARKDALLEIGTRLREVEMYDDHPPAPDVLPPQHQKGQPLSYRVGIGQGEYRFQPWDMWPDDPRWFSRGWKDCGRRKVPYIEAFDDAFYGTSGYLIEMWGKDDTFYEIEDRTPFDTYQGYCGIGPDGIRAWSSHPPGN